MRVHHYAVILALVLVNIVGKVGDVLGPSLVLTQPVVLLLLNANDTHLALTSGLPTLLALAVSAPRRLGEDILYYYAGAESGRQCGWPRRFLYQN